VDWIHLPQDRDQQWGLVNMVTNLSGSIKGRNLIYLSSYQFLKDDHAPQSQFDVFAYFMQHTYCCSLLNPCVDIPFT
jgi:hypothetical protein